MWSSRLKACDDTTISSPALAIRYLRREHNHYYHISITSLPGMDEIVDSRGSCEAAKRISEDEFAGLHKVNIYLLVCCIKARFDSELISF